MDIVALVLIFILLIGTVVFHVDFHLLFIMRFRPPRKPERPLPPDKIDPQL